MPKRLTGFTALGILIVVLVLAVGGIWIFKTQNKTLPKSSPTPLVSPTNISEAIPTSDLTTNWKTYNYDNILTLKYPPSWAVGGGGEGCGPLIGLPTRTGSDMPIYPYITLCRAPVTEDNKSFSFDTQKILEMEKGQTIGVPLITKEVIDGHEIFKVKLNPIDPSTSWIYTVYVNRAYYLSINASFDQNNLQKYGVDNNMTQKGFIAVID